MHCSVLYMTFYDTRAVHLRVRVLVRYRHAMEVYCPRKMSLLYVSIYFSSCCVLYYPVRYSILALFCPVLSCPVQPCTVLCCTVLSTYSVLVLSSPVRSCSILFCTVLSCIVLFSSVLWLYSAVTHILYRAPLSCPDSTVLYPTTFLVQCVFEEAPAPDGYHCSEGNHERLRVALLGRHGRAWTAWRGACRVVNVYERGTSMNEACP